MGAGTMIELTVCCPGCARKTQRCVDEECPPSFVRCACGQRISLVVEAESPTFNIGEYADEEVNVTAKPLSGRGVRI